MKKTTLQKLLALALVGAMTIGTLTACGGEDAPAAASSEAPAKSEAAAPAASSEAAAETPAVAGIDGFVPFAENVTLQIPVYDRGDSGNGCSDVENNYWTNWVQENFGDKYNITVEYIGITRSDVMTDYAMLAAGQDLPTMCVEYDYDKLATWQAEGYLQPYDVEQFKFIAPTYWATMEKDMTTGYTQLGGEDYLLVGSRPYGQTNYTWITWYREDWMKEAGFETYPQTQTELNEMYLKLIENGHEAPLSGSKVSGAGADQNYSYRKLPQDEIVWATTGDYQIPALSTDAQYNFLKLQNFYYNNGIINKEYYLRDASEVEADFINGKAFQWSGYVSSTMNVLNSFYEANPDGDLGIIVCSGEYTYDETWGTTNSHRAGGPMGAYVSFANDATEDEVKAAMMYLEWLAQPENLFTMTWGIEGVNFNYGEDGNPVAVGDQKGLAEQQGHNNNVDYWMLVTAVKTLGSVEADIKAISPVGLPEDFTEDLIANYEGQLKLYNDGYACVDCLFSSVPEAVAEYGTSLKEEVYPELRDQLVMCAPEEFDALYEKLSQQYLDAGYQAIIDGRKAAFDAGQTTRLQ